METKNQNSDQINQPTGSLMLSEQKKSMMIVIGVVLIVILGIFVVVTAIRNRPPQSDSPIARMPVPTKVPRSQMWMDPSSLSTSVGQKITIQVMLDAHTTEINGADAVINYDPAFFSILSIEQPNEPNREFLLIDKQTKGQIQLTTIKSQASNTKTSQMTIATISLTALKNGSTLLNFEYQPGATTGSTVVRAHDSENILDSVTNTTITVK